MIRAGQLRRWIDGREGWQRHGCTRTSPFLVLAADVAGADDMPNVEKTRFWYFLSGEETDWEWEGRLLRTSEVVSETG